MRRRDQQLLNAITVALVGAAAIAWAAGEASLPAAHHTTTTLCAHDVSLKGAVDNTPLGRRELYLTLSPWEWEALFGSHREAKEHVVFRLSLNGEERIIIRPHVVQDKDVFVRPPERTPAP